jgi:oligopeptide/dipeptide ABC transporter ATP-binding protein
MAKTLVEVKALKKYFPVRASLFKIAGLIRAVDDVNLSIMENETLGLVGESGCGKTTLGRTIIRLTEPTSGQILFDGRNITEMRSKELKALRSQMQIVFQDPFSSLNPRMTVLDIVGRPLELQGVRGKEKTDLVLEMLINVGMEKDHLKRYPHEFSGGQRQRIAIARALILKPKFIVLDEPTSSLDVSVQAQILNLLNKLKKDFKLTCLFISHDLSVVKHISDRIAVMYVGEIIEVAKKSELFKSPAHPYTQALLSAIPNPDPKGKKKRIILTGDIASAINPPAGCRFHPRCPFAMDICSKEKPQIVDVEPDHLTTCHLYK